MSVGDTNLTKNCIFTGGLMMNSLNGIVHSSALAEVILTLVCFAEKGHHHPTGYLSCKEYP
jgi:hypothetical protein